MFERWRDPWARVCFDGDDGGGAGDTSGPDESSAYGTDPSAPGFDAANDIGDAIGPAEAAAEAAAIEQAREDEFGGMHTAQQANPSAGGITDPFTGRSVSPQEIATRGAFGLLSALVSAPIGLGMLGLAQMGMRAAGSTPGTDQDAYGESITGPGDIGSSTDTGMGSQGQQGGDYPLMSAILPPSQQSPLLGAPPRELILGPPPPPLLEPEFPPYNVLTPEDIERLIGR